ncbi:LysE family translocator [Sporolactobacillus putidus]|uniref:Lysine transporter LysE n=1 Tax=Sporolactobacillus putidus TaxID=492735 RepID=A0A917S7R3_9BACL|nr:LysE family transporter [Sporolactobacillus putidus]GGL60204.1 lysine transporter LysE [Sporolactobacillus putidus]
MSLSYFVKGLLIGFAIAAPVGPIGVLCIRRSLIQDRLYGWLSGLGAATADALYGSVAGFGLTVITGFLMGGKIWLQVIGGFFLCYLGVQTLRAKPADHAANACKGNLLTAYTSTLFLTLTNPMTILSFVSVFAGLGLAGAQRGYFSSIQIVLGVFAGSALWWLLLSLGVGFFRDKLNLRSLVWINRLSGLTILGFGLVSLGSCLL